MNYIGDHPLNLIGKVAIVTNASSSLGATICRNLLNSNMFVLGVDSSPPHDSTQSTSASHFQFWQYDAEKVLKGKDVVDFAKKMYENHGMKGVDFLIDVLVEGGEERGLTMLDDVVDGMVERGEGLVISVLSGGGNENNVDNTGKRLTARAKLAATKAAALRYQDKGVRFNVLTEKDVAYGSRSFLAPRTKVALEAYIQEHHDRREKRGFQMEKEWDVANLLLFLCTSPARKLNGALLGSDGGCTAL